MSSKYNDHQKLNNLAQVECVMSFVLHGNSFLGDDGGDEFSGCHIEAWVIHSFQSFWRDHNRRLLLHPILIGGERVYCPAY